MSMVASYIVVFSLLLFPASFCMEVDEKAAAFEICTESVVKVCGILGEESCEKHAAAVDLFMEGCPVLTLLHSSVEGDISIYYKRFMEALSSCSVKALLQKAYPDDEQKVAAFIKEFSRPGAHRLNLHFQLSDLAEHNPVISAALRRVITEIVGLGLTKMGKDRECDAILLCVANFVSMVNCPDLNELRRLVRTMPNCNQQLAKIIHRGRFRKTHDLRSLTLHERFLVDDDGEDSRPYSATRGKFMIGLAKL